MESNIRGLSLFYRRTSESLRKEFPFSQDKEAPSFVSMSAFYKALANSTNSQTGIVSKESSCMAYRFDPTDGSDSLK